MAVQCEGGGKDEVKAQFGTREGTYKVMTFSEYRPNRSGCGAQSNHPVKVSFITLPDSSGNGDRICFNVGRELYFHMYKGLRKAADLTKPIDKRVYKGTYPTCHDFNESTASSKSVSLLVGFSAGQIQLIDPIKKESSKLYNEERLIDKSKVTCLRWLPDSPNQFLVAHGSGQMYVYNEELPCGTTPPHYQLFKQGDGFSVYTCKTKSTRNPLYRWVIGEGSLNEFSFSPCFRYLATVGQDGFLRVFGYDTMDLLGAARSYFGGLLCVCWSPDGRYVVTGGEDDLVTVWSFHERRVVARGHGHKSWVSVVAFDAFTTHYGDTGDCRSDNGGESCEPEIIDDEDEDADDIEKSKCSDIRNRTSSSNLAVGSCTPLTNGLSSPGSRSTRSQQQQPQLSTATTTTTTTSSLGFACYRFGSVGQDTQLCLWDLTEDATRQPLGRSRTSILLGQSTSNAAKCPNSSNSPSGSPATTTTTANRSTSTSSSEAFTSYVLPNCVSSSKEADGNLPNSRDAGGGGSGSGGVLKFATPSLSGGERRDRSSQSQTQQHSGSETKEHRRNFSLSSRNSDKNSIIKANHHHHSSSNSNKNCCGSSQCREDPSRLIGTGSCPRLDEVPLLEPLVCKKIAHERMTALIFREDCIVTACQEGFVCTWARPGKVVANKDCADEHGNPNPT